MLGEKISALKLPAPLTVQSGTPVARVVDDVQRHRVECVLVCEGRKLIGIMTERDVLLKIVARDVVNSTPVDEFMTPHPITMAPDQTIGEAIAVMDQHQFRHLPVVDAKSGDILGIFSVSDVIHFLAESFPDQVINLPPRPHQKIMTPEGA